MVVIIFSCAHNKTALTENCPEIENLWIEKYNPKNGYYQYGGNWKE